MKAPSTKFEIRDHRASRLHVPHATLTFTGCEPDKDSVPRATFHIPNETPATANGIEIAGTVWLNFRERFVRWIDRANDVAERRVSWDWREVYLRRVGSHATPPDGARSLLLAFVQAWADDVGTADVMRAAEAARLYDAANGHRDKAASLRKDAEQEDQLAEQVEAHARVVELAPKLFAVIHNGRTIATHDTLAAAIKTACKHGRGNTWGGRPTSHHDYPSVLEVYAGVWHPVPEAVELEKREAAERASWAKP